MQGFHVLPLLLATAVLPPVLPALPPPGVLVLVLALAVAARRRG